MNKKGLQFKLAFFAVIATGVVVVLVGNIIAGWADYYGSGITYDLGNYSGLDSISNEIDLNRESIAAQSSDTSSDPETSTFRRVFGVITDIFSPFDIVFGDNGMIDSITERFGIPDVIRIGIIGMMVTAIIFTIIAIVFRRDRA